MWQWFQCEVLGRCPAPVQCPASQRWWCPPESLGDLAGALAKPLALFALPATAFACFVLPRFIRLAVNALQKIRRQTQPQETGDRAVVEYDEDKAAEATAGGVGDQPDREDAAEEYITGGSCSPSPQQMAGAVPVFPKEVLGSARPARRGARKANVVATNRDSA